MKSFLSGFLSVIFLTQPLFVSAADDDTIAVPAKNKFIVTAYYSPLPNQSYYLKGSYEADVILNGRGTNGASGKEVYIGMLAAPKKYPFGTKIHLEGLGVGVVDDRGGAIVNAGERSNAYDRIDIWMGSGEEGLRRALQWGRRTVNGKILDEWEPTLSVHTIPLAPKSSIASLRIDKESGDIFGDVIDRKSNPEDIEKLQRILADLGYYKAEIDGKWNKKITDSLFDFQVSKKILTRAGDMGAGYLGKKTRELLRGEYDEFQKQQELKKKENEKIRAEQEKIEKELTIKQEKIRAEIMNLSDMRSGDVGQEVRSLQKILQKLGYLNEKDTAIFWEKTQEAVARFQQDNKIIEEKGIGYFWEKTREKLGEKLVQNISQK